MGSLDPNPAKERLAGFITLAVILFSTLTIVLVTQLDWHKYTEYRLVFSLLQDASGIQSGTPVNVGGLYYGKVLSVESGPMLDEAGNLLFTPEEQSTTTQMLGTFVIFELDSTIPLWASAQIGRNASMLGGNVSIQIYDTGFENQTDPQLSRVRLPLVAKSTLRSSNPPSGFVTIFGGPISIELNQMTANFNLFKDWYTQVARKEIVDRFQSIKVSMNSLRANINSDFNDWTPRVTALKTNTTEMNRRLGISNLGEQDPNSYSKIINRKLPQIRADATSAQSDYATVVSEIKNIVSEKMTKAYEDFQKQFARLQADMQTLTAAGKEANGAYADSVAALSLSGGQIYRAFQELLSGIVRAIVDKPNDAEFAKQDQLMFARELAVQAQKVQEAVEDLEKLANQMQSSSPDMADTIRQRTAATLAQLKKSLDAFHATLQTHNLK
ncbi:MAG: hypothetical protein EXS12_02750 [Phycisphaerales bacterium]|nr:hypothetical protein [Phycisphaerales bacterium]